MSKAEENKVCEECGAEIEDGDPYACGDTGFVCETCYLNQNKKVEVVS